MAQARDRILASVRAGLGRAGPVAETQAAALRAEIATHRAGPRPHATWEPVNRFGERARLLASTVDQVRTRNEIPAAVARYLAAHSLPLRAVAWPEFASLDWPGVGIVVEHRAAQSTDLVGITGSYCAIAETGTLMLLSGPSTPATTSLLPETHVAVAACDRIVATMEDAWALVRAELGQPPRAVNFVSGPSRTADIEQTLVLGAHGPYRVHVILVGAGSSRA